MIRNVHNFAQRYYFLFIYANIIAFFCYFLSNAILLLAEKEYINQQPKQLVSYLSLRFERFFQQLARQSYGEADRSTEGR